MVEAPLGFDSACTMEEADVYLRTPASVAGFGDVGHCWACTRLSRVCVHSKDRIHRDLSQCTGVVVAVRLVGSGVHCGLLIGLPIIVRRLRLQCNRLDTSLILFLQSYDVQDQKTAAGLPARMCA